MMSLLHENWVKESYHLCFLQDEMCVLHENKGEESCHLYFLQDDESTV